MLSELFYDKKEKPVFDEDREAFKAILAEVYLPQIVE